MQDTNELKNYILIKRSRYYVVYRQIIISLSDLYYLSIKPTSLRIDLAKVSFW